MGGLLILLGENPVKREKVLRTWRAEHAFDLDPRVNIEKGEFYDGFGAGNILLH